MSKAVLTVPYLSLTSYRGRREEEVDAAEILRRKTEAGRRPSEEVRRFRLFERCMWVATYYRTVGKRAARRRELQRRLRAWGAAVCKAKRREGEAAAGDGDAGRAVGGCSRSGRPLEAPQRFCPDDGTMDSTVTRGYTQTPVAQRQWDLLMRRQRKVQVVTGTQTGRRMLDMMRSVAVPGGRLDRRGEG